MKRWLLAVALVIVIGVGLVLLRLRHSRALAEALAKKVAEYRRVKEEIAAEAEETRGYYDAKALDAREAVESAKAIEATILATIGEVRAEADERSSRAESDLAKVDSAGWDDFRFIGGEDDDDDDDDDEL